MKSFKSFLKEEDLFEISSKIYRIYHHFNLIHSSEYNDKIRKGLKQKVDKVKDKNEIVEINPHKRKPFQ